MHHETVHCNFYTSLFEHLRPIRSRKRVERGFGSYLLVLHRRSSMHRPNHPNRKNRIACLSKSDSAHTKGDFSDSAYKCQGSCIAWRMQNHGKYLYKQNPDTPGKSSHLYLSTGSHRLLSDPCTCLHTQHIPLIAASQALLVCVQKSCSRFQSAIILNQKHSDSCSKSFAD